MYALCNIIRVYYVVCMLCVCVCINTYRVDRGELVCRVYEYIDRGELVCCCYS